MAKNLELKVVLSAIDRMTGPMRGITKQSKRMSQGYKTDMRGYRETIKKTESSLKLIEQQNKNMLAAGMPLSQHRIDQEKKYREQLISTNNALNSREALMDKEMSAIRRRQAALDRGKSQMTRGGIQMAAASAATYAGARFMAPGFDFEEQMSKVQALTRLDKDDPMLEKLKEQAKELGATTWASATQAADAQGFYAMAGFDPQAIMDALPSTLDLAKAGDVDVGRAADIGSNILSAFGLDPSQMNEVADILVSVFTRTNTSIEMLGDTMKYVGPVARELKIPLEESAAMAGILGNVGIQGTQAGTALRALQSRLAAPPAAAKKALKALNVQTKDAAGNFRSMPDILADVMKSTEKLGSADKMGYLKAIAGEEAGAAFASFLNENSYDELMKVIEAARNADGEAAEVATKMSDNVKGDWVGLLSAIESVQIGVSELEGGGLRSLLQTITKIVRATSGWIKENPKLAGTIFKVTAGIIGVVAGLGALTFAMGVFNMVVLANPIVLVIGAVIAAITALLYYKDEVTVFFKTFLDAPMKYINKAIGFFDGLYDTIVNFISNIPVVGPLLKVAFELATAPIRIVWELIKLILKGFEWLGRRGVTVKSVLTAIWSPIANAMKPVFDWIGKIFTGFMDLISYEGSVWRFFKAFTDAPGVYIRNAIAFIGELYQKTKAFLTELPVIGPLFQVAFSVAEKAASLFMKSLDIIIKGIKYLWDNIGNVGQVFQAMWNGVKIAMQPIVDLFTMLIDLIAEILSGIKDLFSFETPQWMTDVGNWAGQKWDQAFGNQEVVYSAPALVGGASIVAANPVTNTNNQTNHVEINVTAQTNASAAVIATETVNQLRSTGLIGDMR